MWVRSIRKPLTRSFPAKRPYSPWAGRNFPTRPLFGDTHLHTMFSFDAGAFGARLGPSDAYRFAKGEEVVASSGQPAKLSRPLDFLVVADHSDNMGFFPDLSCRQARHAGGSDGSPVVRHDPVGQGSGCGDRNDRCVFSRNLPAGARSRFPERQPTEVAWEETIKAAEEANDPGRFTAFIGYEWTSNTGGNNLHRNVIFRDNGRKEQASLSPSRR